MKKYNIKLNQMELDFLTDLIGSSITSFERIIENDTAIGKRTKPEYIESCNWQKELFNKLNKYTNDNK